MQIRAAWLRRSIARVWLDEFVSAARALPRVVAVETAWQPPPAAVVFVLGGPGSGKGTVCKGLVRKREDWQHLSAGDLLRAEQERGGEHAEVISDCIVRGTIVPVAITVDLLLRAMQSKDASLFLVDGFPRNTRNLAGWQRCAENSVGSSSKNSPQMQQPVSFRGLLSIECSEKTMRMRLLRRGKTSGRADDNEASIVKRFDIFRNSTMPILEFFDELGELYTVSGDQDAASAQSDALSILTRVEAQHMSENETQCIATLRLVLEEGACAVTLAPAVEELLACTSRGGTAPTELELVREPER